MALVTVIIPARDRSSLLGKCIESVLVQSLHADIKIFDDGSEDPVRWVGEGVEVHRSDEVMGQCYARNFWVPKVTTPFLKWIDSDDYLIDSGVLERQVNFLQEHPVLDFCWDGFKVYDSKLRKFIGESALGPNTSLDLALPDNFVRGFSRRPSSTAVQIGTATFRTSSLKKVQWNEDYKQGGADLRFFSDVAKSGMSGTTTGELGLVHLASSPGPNSGLRYS